VACWRQFEHLIFIQSENLGIENFFHLHWDTSFAHVLLSISILFTQLDDWHEARPASESSG